MGVSHIVSKKGVSILGGRGDSWRVVYRCLKGSIFREGGVDSGRVP